MHTRIAMPAPFIGRGFGTAAVAVILVGICPAHHLRRGAPSTVPTAPCVRRQCVPSLEHAELGECHRHEPIKDGCLEDGKAAATTRTRPLRAFQPGHCLRNPSRIQFPPVCVPVCRRGVGMRGKNELGGRLALCFAGVGRDREAGACAHDAKVRESLGPVSERQRTRGMRAASYHERLEHAPAAGGSAPRPPARPPAGGSMDTHG